MIKWWQSVGIFLWVWVCLGILFATAYPFQFKPFHLDTRIAFCVPQYVCALEAHKIDTGVLTNHVCFVTQQLLRTRTLYANHPPMILSQPWQQSRISTSQPEEIVTLLTPPTTGAQLYFPNSASQSPPRNIAPNTLVVLTTVDAETQGVQVFGVGTKVWTWRLNWATNAHRGNHKTKPHKKKWRIITDRKYRYHHE